VSIPTKKFPVVLFHNITVITVPASLVPEDLVKT